MNFDPTEEISDKDALAMIRTIVSRGAIVYSAHVKDRMRERNFTTQDICYILQNGTLNKKEYNPKHQNWTYSIRGFDLDEEEGCIITAILTKNSILLITVTS